MALVNYQGRSRFFFLKPLMLTKCNCSSGPGCFAMPCYDTDKDPRGEDFIGCANKTASGRTCQVNACSKCSNIRNIRNFQNVQMFKMFKYSNDLAGEYLIETILSSACSGLGLHKPPQAWVDQFERARKQL